MTNDTIKPGYYWAEYGGYDEIIEVVQFDAELFFFIPGSDEKHNINAPFLQVIAPALPPDQWPTYETMCAASDKVDGSFKKHTFERGFLACYKLFTGKDLQIK